MHGCLGRAGARRGFGIDESAVASVFHGRDDRAPVFRAAALLLWRRLCERREGSSSSHNPNFSRKAAFLLDAMAALPRKWVSGVNERADSTAAQWNSFVGLFLESPPLGSRLFQEVAGVIPGGHPILARQTTRGF